MSISYIKEFGISLGIVKRNDYIGKIWNQFKNVRGTYNFFRQLLSKALVDVLITDEISEYFVQHTWIHSMQLSIIRFVQITNLLSTC